jgi:hypothetical protein
MGYSSSALSIERIAAHRARGVIIGRDYVARSEGLLKIEMPAYD